ncbi:NUDIX domain-containing protein [Hirsutella rhossiliensis]|uniref:NUDIX domain-containing protein n=1 Tax=Hirsutella rhossiliensis TaxID=111463 RepID=A0A9P8N619_9HYPO|nr:NUDIX domain-containing protein [Hirsutella rhossiliensis]KAH0967590.1 NUDIX domain-containing protein [Hirsutella rhossiliensis]
MEPESANRVTAAAAPNTFEVSPGVAEFNMPISEYMRLNPSISRLAVGAMIFSGNHIMLIQRASHDFAPLMWEVPGGACEANKDATILHSVSRELWEETGLRLRSVKKHVDNVEFDDGRQHALTWRKITFEVEVDEGHGLGPAERRDVISAAVKLNPTEHRGWGWAQMAEVEEGKGGKQFMELQRSTILAALNAAR